MSRSNKCALKDHFSCYAENGFNDVTAVVKQRDTGRTDMDKVLWEGRVVGRFETFSE